jgi:tetratricopeptide (TPR) repeat protein
VVFVGVSGEGKTTLAAELARWLLMTRRFERAIFVNFDECQNERSFLGSIGRQLIPEYGVKAEHDAQVGRQLIERALGEQRILLVLDNLESILSATEQENSVFEPQFLDHVLSFCKRLSRIGSTRLVFTTRQRLPPPFDGNEIRIGRLGRNDAISLIASVLEQLKLTPSSDDCGYTEIELEQLVDTVHCHARSLVFLAREVATFGVRRATRRMTELMSSLEPISPNERERALFASIDLSLRRLPATTRRQIRSLAVFHGGGSISTIGMVLGYDATNKQAFDQAVFTIVEDLVDVGLAELSGLEYVRFHPVLTGVLSKDLTPDERSSAMGRWARATTLFAIALNETRHSNPKVAFPLAWLEMPNLLALIDYLAERGPTNQFLAVSAAVEGLLENQGRTATLSRVIEVRQRQSPGEGWSSEVFLVKYREAQRLLKDGRIDEALTLSRQILFSMETVGTKAYPRAAYDLAHAKQHVGRVLFMKGNPTEALPFFTDATSSFTSLNLPKDALIAQSDVASCLMDMGKLEEAVAAYQRVISAAENVADQHTAAVARFQLGSVWFQQGKHQQALQAYASARDFFTGTHELESLAQVLILMGRAHVDLIELDEAEVAFQRALQVSIQVGKRLREAEVLLELGTLSVARQRLEEGLEFIKKGAEIYQQLKNDRWESNARANAAHILIKLKRFKEANAEIVRTIDCEKNFEKKEEPWKTFDYLSQIEAGLGNETASLQALERARNIYIAHCGSSGTRAPFSGHLFHDVRSTLQTGRPTGLSGMLDAISDDPSFTPAMRAAALALNAVLNGSRDKRIASDPRLHFTDALEMEILINELNRNTPA